MNSVAIVGAGITGLTAAFRLRERGIPVTLYEAGSRAGGVIQTLRHHGYLVEHGPNTILETSPLISELIKDLGVEKRRLYSDPQADKRFIVRGKKPVQLPSSALRFLTTPLFSASAKLRLAREIFIPPAPQSKEESLGEFVVRRLGREFLDYAINPFVAGVYSGDPHRLSVKHAFPKLHALEQKYGSLLKGQVLGARERKRRAEVSKQNARKFSFDEGLETLTSTLGSRIGDALKLKSKIIQIRRQQSGWRLLMKDSEGISEAVHEAVLFAGPAHKVRELEFQPGVSLNWPALGEIVYAPVATVGLAFKREQVAHPLDGFGMLIPEVERFAILGTIFSSSLFPNRAPSGEVLLTSYIGGTRAPHWVSASPEELFDVTRKDLETLLGVSGKPTFHFHHAFYQAIPQYEVGYGRFKSLMDNIEKNSPGFFFAGHYRDGISLGDSIVSGHNAAEKIGHYLNSVLKPAPLASHAN